MLRRVINLLHLYYYVDYMFVDIGLFNQFRNVDLRRLN